MVKRKIFLVVMLFSLVFSLVVANRLLANAAIGITLTPISGEPGNSVRVVGTDFSASSALGIGFGPEVQVDNESVNVTGSGTGPWWGVLVNAPIKPGSFNMTSDTAGVQVTYSDNGNGTLSSPSEYFVSGIINYTSGVFNRVSTTDLSDYTLIHIVDYTCYETGVTPVSGVRSDASGSFTVNFTVPMVANGTHSVTVVDEKGGFAGSTFTVVGSPIPETLSICVVVLLSVVAVIIATLGFRKRPKSDKNR